MHLILFAHENSYEKGARLQASIHQTVSHNPYELIQTFNALKSRLKRFSDYQEKEIFILLAETRQRLNELISLIDLLLDKKVILVLPEDTEDCIHQAHAFFPRYFTFMNSSYSDLNDVLLKMIQNHQKQLTV